ncbi:catechol O-methyltransferase A [Microcaecilia unicolor]|uniref:catechol O-methyltransferase n=1 Tax=Microcaecilia unicolor TaxID=1415580 RepID=A0A6P7X2L2_9AMPH|nr:catechol O-methyltransferase A-like [Microcaecilia unicolor]XP_030049803.1 catechol O-methyltransferase A-like [Microcaecilia unicolor]XP_030049804.1 catechol O-methyltransferase A-like [Microcaecilia unicolor]XP_030049805.1 catechol O-methyltransferase A-like [Microcaecilia unicolor]XP_030049806.1 catechol O-methyltransferase A-like [Microcaecilia unicolor]XP_030049807.1 catechol O-methyltransferase A-like [Microcaecilia unicolor]
MLYMVALAAGIVLVGILLVHRQVRRNGRWALWWHDRVDENIRDFLTRISRPERILAYVKKHAVPGDAESVANAIDAYCSGVEWAMNIGIDKGKILDRVVSETDPDTVLELGTYCGYSTVRIGKLLRPEARLITIEMNPDYAKVAKQIIALAGLDSKVEILVGSSSELIPQLKKKLDIKTLDLVFIDHWKECYLPDTRCLEESGLLHKGTVLLADNVVCPGAPEYVKYIRNSSRYRSEYFSSRLEYLQVEDGLEKSVFLG